MNARKNKCSHCKMQGHTKPKCPQLSKVDKEKAKKTASNRVVKIAKLAQSSKVGMEVDNCSDSDSEGNELKKRDVDHKSAKTSPDLDDDMVENIVMEIFDVPVRVPPDAVNVDLRSGVKILIPEKGIPTFIPGYRYKL